MKHKKVILGFLVMLIVGTNSFIYAGDKPLQCVEEENQQEHQRQQESLAQLYHKAGLDKPEVIISTLERLGISNEDIQEAIEQGKKIFEVLQEKEITQKAFKNALSEEYDVRIKQARRDRIITRREAKLLRKLLQQRMDAWKV